MQEDGIPKIRSFTQLKAWQEGHKLVVRVYKEVKSFPKAELFSNIAEGFGRRSGPDKAHFYTIAQGSTTELQNQLLIARDVGYLSPSTFQAIASQSVSVSKLINGLLRSVRRT